jgi:eukaryotic-like serine/threonine-protein kinase
MSLCINPHCPSPLNQDTLLFCQSCHSELLLDARYRVICQLGSGGFGKTYEVRDSTLYNSSSTLTDLKVLKVLGHNHPKYVELFRREADFLSRINHPGVPQVESDAYFLFYPHNSLEPLHCLIMEKIEGLDLKKYITQRGSGISEKRAMQWLMQISQILGEIHKCNFFHRDIKPSNIMLRATGQLVLIDFGTARELTNTYISKQDAGQLTGLFSAGYSPLEQLNGQAILQSDFFALGRTMVFLLTGKNPSDMYDSHENKLLWHQYAPGISPEFANFLDSLMAESASYRPESAAVIIGQLTQIYQRVFGSDSSLPIPSVTTQSSITQIAVNYSDSTVAYPNTTEIPQSEQYLIAAPVTTQPPDILPSIIDTQFINRCQRELTELIGPMAAIICQRTLANNSTISSQDFVKTLARLIPNPEIAKDFQKRLLD